MATTPRLEFVYKLEGDVAEIDVFQLAPTLLALGRVIQEANRTLNPEGPDIAVNVKPFSEGSFLVDVILFQAPLVSLLAALGADPVQKISEVLRTIGFIRGATTSVLEVIKKLGRKPDTVEALGLNEVRFTAGDTSVTTNGPVGKLMINPVFNEHIYQAYKPLEQPNVTDIRSFLRGQRRRPL